MDIKDCGKPYHVINNTKLHTNAGGCKRKTALSSACTIYGPIRKITDTRMGYYYSVLSDFTGFTMAALTA